MIPSFIHLNKHQFKLRSFLILIFCVAIYPIDSQIIEGQNFCDGNKKGAYFPLNIKEKFIIWGDTYYVETHMGSESMNGKNYEIFKQEWESGDIGILHLRNKNGITYQFEDCTNMESIRLNTKFKKSHSWERKCENWKYRIVSKKGKLKTPLCKYNKLIVIEALIEGTRFHYYYLKGLGYIGATVNGELISFLAPIHPSKLKKERYKRS
ncbi:MAG: hypothetical protein AAF487_00735 [Bacteroidota bacterium]